MRVDQEILGMYTDMKPRPGDLIEVDNRFQFYAWTTPAPGVGAEDQSITLTQDDVVLMIQKHIDGELFVLARSRLLYVSKGYDWIVL